MNKPFGLAYGNASNVNVKDDDVVEVFDFDGVFRAFKRQWHVLAVCIVVSLAIGVAYKITAVPLYAAQVNVLIDRANSQIISQLSTTGAVIDDEATILSQVELIESEAIGVAVVDKLKLTSDPAFMLDKETYLTRFLSWMFSTVDPITIFNKPNLTTEEQAKRRVYAYRKLQNSISVQRVGRTYVLTIMAVTQDRVLSAKIANAVGDAYIEDKLNSKYDATRRASVWLQQRIDELRSKTYDSDLAVQRFRKDHGLVAAGNQLVTDQQLTELSSALILAQSDTAQAKAKYERIQRILSEGQTDAIVTDVLASSISNDLRKRYLDASKLETELSKLLGPNHVRAIQLRAEMAEYRRLMFDELTRIAESYKSELDVAMSREKSLSDSVKQATGVNASANETQVELRQLEREAETYKNLYQTFLNRYQETVQQQSFPISEARVITQALPATRPAYPRYSSVLAIFFVLGSAIGFAIAGLREYSDRFFRTAADVRDALGMNCLGMLPLLNKAKLAGASRARNSLPEKVFSLEGGMYSYAADNPLSQFAETLRLVKFTAESTIGRRDGGIVLGVVSAIPNEGKTTVSVNLAQFIASQDKKTVLLDFDLRNPGATRATGATLTSGLVDLTEGKAALDDVLVVEANTGLNFVSSTTRSRIAHSSEIVNSQAVVNMIAELRRRFDFIIIDLPPLAPLVDARETAGLVDGFVFVTEWGKSSRRAVRSVMQNEPLIMDKCLGVVLNKVDKSKLHLYNPMGSADAYSKRYEKYYF